MPDQPNIHIETGNSSDHDILLTLKAELGTKLDRVIVDVKELKDNFAARVTDLEQEKVSKEDFDEFKEAIAKYQDDIGKTLFPLQRLVYIGFGIVLAIQFALLIYVTYYHP